MRRLRTFRITDKELGQFLIEGSSFRCMDGIPSGSSVIGAQYDFLSNKFDVVVEHGSFEETPEGERPLCLWPRFERLD